VSLLIASAGLAAQSLGRPAIAGLSTAQIVDRMQDRNMAQTAELKHYRSVRHYKVVYNGFSTTIEGELVVEVNYDASMGKNFRILSQSGSKFLCEKVLKRAVDSEKEASLDKNSTALTTANYRFSLLGNGEAAGRPAYLLRVDPIRPSKFLYRGTIWVDEADFAVVKVEAEPARNPSFFISRTTILTIAAQTGRFWLPRSTRSETKVRFGGTAVLTIDFGTYEVVAKDSRASAGG
jgi:hypothetical protein